MYLPTHFEETRVEVLHALLRAHPLGLLITRSPGAADGTQQPADELQANSLPFLLEVDASGTGPSEGRAILRGHVARANPLWQLARCDVDSLVVFQGPQAYVSPSFYASKPLHGKVVPTWNYISVQARGRLRVIDDAAWVHALVTRLTDRHEAARAVPWAVDDAPGDFIGSLVGAIVGIEIELTALVGKWKVSQNRSDADRAGVVRGLRDDGLHGADADLLGLGPALAPAPAPEQRD